MRSHRGGGDPLTRLREQFPGIVIHEENGRVVDAYGVPMTTAETADAAADAFLAEHGEIFASGLDLRRTLRTTVKDGLKTVFGYAQRVEGLPVEDSIARIVVHDTHRVGGQRWAVVFAAGYLANPVLPLSQRLITSRDALATVQQDPRAAGLARWSPPEETVAWDRAFRARFDDGDQRACNMDVSTGPAVCDVFDMLAFQTEFASGCP